MIDIKVSQSRFTETEILRVDAKLARLTFVMTNVTYPVLHMFSQRTAVWTQVFR